MNQVSIEDVQNQQPITESKSCNQYDFLQMWELDMLNSLKPSNYEVKFRIKVRVVRCIKRTVSENKHVLDLDLIDEQGTMIKCQTFYHLHFDIFKEGKVYIVEKGRVEPANRNFTSIQHEG